MMRRSRERPLHLFPSVCKPTNCYINTYVLSWHQCCMCVHCSPSAAEWGIKEIHTGLCEEEERKVKLLWELGGRKKSELINQGSQVRAGKRRWWCKVNEVKMTTGDVVKRGQGGLCSPGWSWRNGRLDRVCFTTVKPSLCQSDQWENIYSRWVRVPRCCWGQVCISMRKSRHIFSSKGALAYFNSLWSTILLRWTATYILSTFGQNILGWRKCFSRKYIAHVRIPEVVGFICC